MVSVWKQLTFASINLYKYIHNMTTAKILIEKNIPIEKDPTRKYPFSTMEIGDSFDAGEYSTEKANSVYGSVYNYKRTAGNDYKKFVVRKKDGRVRVWRES